MQHRRAGGLSQSVRNGSSVTRPCGRGSGARTLLSPPCAMKAAMAKAAASKRISRSRHRDRPDPLAARIGQRIRQLRDRGRVSLRRFRGRDRVGSRLCVGAGTRAGRPGCRHARPRRPRLGRDDRRSRLRRHRSASVSSTSSAAALPRSCAQLRETVRKGRRKPKTAARPVAVSRPRASRPPGPSPSGAEAEPASAAPRGTTCRRLRSRRGR